VHLLTLARLGVGAFHIADFDTFDIVNFNRQAGAAMSTLDQPKADVMARMARDINPELDIRLFKQGVDLANLDDFFDGVDLYVDSLDFFAFPARQATFAACARLGVPATTAAPLGMGAALLNFLPGQMTFEEYFGWGTHSDEEKALRFMLGLAPANLHSAYLVDPSAINFNERRGPSTIMGCQLCAGVAATESLKILLGRGEVLSAPHGMHFDAYSYQYVKTHIEGGWRNPQQQAALRAVRARMGLPEPRE
jgi:molybdopterin/thiamine biosynthesis adenylyltransferase